MNALTIERWLTSRAALAAAIAAAALTLALLVPRATGAQEATYSADLVGANEVPAVDTVATGTFTATIDDTAQTITYTLSVPVIAGATAAHIHQAAADVNGPVVLALYSSAGENAIDLTATLGATGLAGPLAGDWPGFVAGLADGSLHVNVHTTANAGGEIRGQVALTLPPPPATPSAPPAPAAGGTTAPALALLVLSLAAIAGARVLTGRGMRR
ncbi:MAG: CHRD domain-containing protein [Chloroflexi bacterium]|nr:CHRD domain-containing protein [Chloroflexota bacterium]